MSDTPWKTENWFTSPWNFAPEVTKDWKFPEKIQIHDVTLRDGEQQAGLAFDFDDKIRIAEALAEAGVHRIEAGMPVVSKDDARVVQELARRDFGPGLPEVAPDERINVDRFMSTLSDDEAAKEAARCLQCHRNALG